MAHVITDGLHQSKRKIAYHKLSRFFRQGPRRLPVGPIASPEPA
jgi:hypothetical protein